MLCPNCGTDELRTLPAAFELETSLSGPSMTEVSGDDARPRDRRPSAAEARVAPPVFRNVDKSIGCITVFGVVGIAWHIVWVVAGIFFALAIRDAWWNTTVWPRLYIAWEESYVCERCGFIGAAGRC